jgi:hypothetical protein
MISLSLLILASAFFWQPCQAWVSPLRLPGSPVHQAMSNNNNNNNQNNKEPPMVFPLSTRTALVEKAKQLDANLAKGATVGSYSSVGW